MVSGKRKFTDGGGVSRKGRILVALAKAAKGGGKVDDKHYTMSQEEVAALLSGDIKRVEHEFGLDERHTQLLYKLSQDKIDKAHTKETPDTITKTNVGWANPGALGLAAFGFTTILLQIHNIGWIPSTMPIIWGFFWGGAAQIIAGIIDARRGDTFGFTAFTAYGSFWLGLAFASLLEWLGVITLDGPSLAWTMIAWGIFSGYMTIGASKISRLHLFIFTSLTVLFGLLGGYFFGVIPAHIAGIEGIFVGGAAVYCSAAVIMNAQYGRWVFPIGLPKPKTQKSYPVRFPETYTSNGSRVDETSLILRGSSITNLKDISNN